MTCKVYNGTYIIQLSFRNKLSLQSIQIKNYEFLLHISFYMYSKIKIFFPLNFVLSTNYVRTLYMDIIEVISYTKFP